MLSAVNWCDLSIFLETISLLFGLFGFIAKKKVKIVEDFLRDLHSQESWQKWFKPLITRLWGYIDSFLRYILSSMELLTRKIETVAERRVFLVSLPIVIIVDILVAIAIVQLYIRLNKTSAILVIVALVLSGFFYSRRVIKEGKRQLSLYNLFLYWFLTIFYLPSIILVIILSVIVTIIPATLWIALASIAFLLHIALRVVLSPYYLLDRIGKPFDERGLATFFLILSIILFFSDRFICP